MAELDKIDRALKVMEGFKSVDSSMFQSKKFAAFMTIQVCWTVVHFYSIYADVSDTVLLAQVAALGAAQTTFLGIQGWHDKHVKTAKVQAMNGGVTASVQAATPAETSET